MANAIGHWPIRCQGNPRKRGIRDCVHGLCGLAVCQPPKAHRPRDRDRHRGLIPRHRLEGEPMKKRGFTLLELTFVISIIAVLAAVLFPVFARARESARRASCASNLSQLGVALNMYAQAYDGHYPGKNNQLGPLYNYAHNVDIFYSIRHCKFSAPFPS